MTATPYIQMRRSITGLLGEVTWPKGIRLKPFSESRAPACHALLGLAYKDGGGSVPEFKQWWDSLSQDDEFDFDLCFPVYGGNGDLVGFAQCWTRGFVKDLVVHPRHRRQGIGRALLTHIFQVFQQRDIYAVSLKVELSNPSGAIQLYESLGMRRI